LLGAARAGFDDALGAVLIAMLTWSRNPQKADLQTCLPISTKTCFDLLKKRKSGTGHLAVALAVKASIDEKNDRCFLFQTPRTR
ncbi:MAG: hypothetical protein EA424_14900, partial [Planctomycetaceae bacterium]